MQDCNLQEQIANLKELENKFLTIKFRDSVTNEVSTQIKFQEGMIVTLRSVPELQLYLKEKHNLPWLMTSHCDQNYQESLHGQLKNGSRGRVSRPSALVFNYRIAR